MSSKQKKTYKKLYQVEQIVDMEYNPERKQYMYQVKWLGFPSSQNTWEPLEHLENVMEMVEEFKNRKRNKEKKAKKSRRRLEVNMSQGEEEIVPEQLETPSLSKTNKEQKSGSSQKGKQFDYQMIYDKLEKAFNDFVRKYQKLNAKMSAEKKCQAEQNKSVVGSCQEGKFALPLSYFPWQGEPQIKEFQKSSNIDY